MVMASKARWKKFRRALSGDESAPIGWRMRFSQFFPWRPGRRPIDRSRDALRILAERKIPSLLCEDVNDAENIRQFGEFKADIILSAAYPQIFKNEILNLIPGRVYNSHPSLLPRCRGAHPVFWSIASGEKRTGSTIHVMTSELDKGEIVSQVEVVIDESATYSTLYNDLISTIPTLLTRFSDFLVAPPGEQILQHDVEGTYFRNDREIHRRIFWTEMDARQIHNLVRACAGRAFFWHANRRIAVWKTEIAVENRNLTNKVRVPAGTIVDILEGFPVISTRDGYIKLVKFSSFHPGKTRFSVGMIVG